MMGRLFFCLFILLLLIPHVIEERKDAYRGLASSWTIVPSRSLAGLHYLFKGYKEDESQGVIQVTGPVIEITDGNKLGANVFKDGYSVDMEPEDFEEEQTLGLSVFEATTRTGTSVGTAFLVGQNLVLTNRHVMAYTKEAKNWTCGKFSIKLNHKDEKVDCEKVRYCSSRYDFCVIEMRPMLNGSILGVEVRPLRLTRKVKADKDVALLHIGNAAGLGIQGSRGRGLKVEGGEFYHYAPTLGGSSGAPIFNEKGEVVGINWGHTGENFISETAFNRGVLMETVFNELKTSKPDVLKEIKSMRPWFHRMFHHRQVKIESK